MEKIKDLKKQIQILSFTCENHRKHRETYEKIYDDIIKVLDLKDKRTDIVKEVAKLKDRVDNLQKRFCSQCLKLNTEDCKTCEYFR